MSDDQKNNEKPIDKSLSKLAGLFLIVLVFIGIKYPFYFILLLALGAAAFFYISKKRTSDNSKFISFDKKETDSDTQEPDNE